MGQIITVQPPVGNEPFSAVLRCAINAESVGQFQPRVSYPGKLRPLIRVATLKELRAGDRTERNADTVSGLVSVRSVRNSFRVAESVLVALLRPRVGNPGLELANAFSVLAAHQFYSVGGPRPWLRSGPTLSAYLQHTSSIFGRRSSPVARISSSVIPFKIASWQSAGMSRPCFRRVSSSPDRIAADHRATLPGLDCSLRRVPR